jgi:aspartate aminotransferase
MSLLNQQMQGYQEKSSWIRKMFEKGAELKARHGQDAVCDFSLGNPDLPPPDAVGKALHELADNAKQPFAFGYMPNPGYPWAREALAKQVSVEQGTRVDAEDMMLTCGAAGGLNALFRAVLEPGDEVVCPAPFFVEYVFYVQNHGGVLKPAPAKPLTFELDLESLERAMGPRTRCVLINSPNNPSGAVYSRKQLRDLADLVDAKSAEYKRPIFLVSDEPYRFLTFDDVEVPSILPLYPYSVVVSSFSKNLSLAGERVGYVLLAPDMPGREELMGGLVLANRILGFVNAPAIGQALAAKCAGERVRVSVYERRRDSMARVLADAGYSFTMPKGAFYFFPQAPGGDDVAFVQKLQEQLILAVPGSGFGYPGYFRLTFCVDESIIERSAEGFKKAMA